jgi:predicted porin
MNKNIKLAVAGAVLALSATAANAGIIIPAGEWTIDLSGNVNSYAVWLKSSGSDVAGGLAHGAGSTGHGQSTGLLPNFLSFAGSTRQNDLDVTWLISLNPGGFSTHSGSGGSGAENRQAFMTFGDKSWGSVKIGKDLGIYASDAILNDMTLLGVGAPVETGTTTLGRIGTGFQYADWKQQIAYTTPNFNGFQATAGITQSWNATSVNLSDAKLTALGNISTAAVAASFASDGKGGASPAYEGKASYTFAANDVKGKVWVSGFTQKVSGALAGESQAWSADIGANLNVAGFDLVGYYYGGEGTGTTLMLRDGYSKDLKKRDVDGGYVQVKYTLPTKTVAGISWGQSNLDKASGETASGLVKSNEMITVGLYHPLTKHVNLVAEYSHLESESQTGLTGTTNVGSLGGILFF